MRLWAWPQGGPYHAGVTRRFPDATTVQMLTLTLLGAGLGVLRAARGENAGLFPLLAWVPALLLPTLLLAWAAYWLAGRSPRAGRWGGAAAGLAAGVFSFAALQPEYQASGLHPGIYALLGWVLPLGPVFLLGALVGSLSDRLARLRSPRDP